MPITSEDIRATAGNYLHRYREDRDRLAPLTAALAGGWKLTDRAEMRGHVTAAAFLAREDSTVLHHQTGLWLGPGARSLSTPRSATPRCGNSLKRRHPGRQRPAGPGRRHRPHHQGQPAKRQGRAPPLRLPLHRDADRAGSAATGRPRGARWTRLDPGRYRKAAERLASGRRQASGHAL